MKLINQMNQISITDQIQLLIESLRDRVDKVPWENKRVYGNFLAQTHYISRHATRIMAKAAYKCPFDCDELHFRLLSGALEEKGHEKWALHDLNTMKFSLKDFDELAEATAFYSTVYRLVDEGGPFELVGYSIILEGLAATGCQSLIARLIESHGLNACRFVKNHMELDEDHYGKGLQTLSSLPPQDQERVIHGARVAASLYAAMLGRISESANEAPELLAS